MVEGQHSNSKYTTSNIDNSQEASDKGPTKNAITVCKDDPSFLYKDQPGIDCAFLGANKLEKCLKLHGNETL